MSNGLLVLGSKKYGEVSLYEVMQNITTTILKYSKAQPTWTKPGKNAYSIKNTGDGFVFKDHLSGEKLKIDYCQAEALRALLKLVDTSESTFEYFEKK